jgi:hypothetical protein
LVALTLKLKSGEDPPFVQAGGSQVAMFEQCSCVGERGAFRHITEEQGANVAFWHEAEVRRLSA